MAFYPDVQPGDDLDYSAQRENDLRHLLNAGNGFGDGVNRGSTHKVRVPVWNITPNNINAGSLVYVVVSGNSMCGEAFPVAPVTDYSDFDFDSAPFGVLENSLKPKATGDLVLSGTVSVSISGGTEGNFAKPTADGSFERGQEGFRILHLNGSSAIILVGDYRYGFAPGVGIDKEQLYGGTISTALVQGSNVTLTPDPDTGAITISATGGTSGGGGLDIPPYSALTFGGGAPDYGLGHTFILAVKAGNVGFWDEGGGAVGKWTNKNGTTSVSLTNKTAYNASEDGWLRISVVDDGSASGECLAFFSQTGGFPLYKYGYFGGSTVTPYSYTGSFAVANFDAPSTPGEPVVVEGETIGIGIEGETVAHCVKIYDTNNRDFYNEYAGYVHIGQDKYRVSSYMTTYASGQSVYLVGTFDVNNDLYFEFKTIDSYFPTINENQFCVRICYEDGGEMIQAQYGDIVQPSRFTQNLSSSVNGGTATVSLSGSTYTVKFIAGLNTTITSGENGEIKISTMGGGGGGIGYPDYLALNKLPSGIPAPSGSGQGIGSTYLLPVPAGVSIKYYSPIQYCVGLFAVADGWDGTPYVLANDTAYTTPAAGWVRISILDDGDHQNGCLRFYVGTSDWTKALPLYRCGTFRAGATGISSTVSGGTATISLTGGTGSVKIKSGNNVSISSTTNGEFEISASGGGGGDENVEYVWFGSVPPANLDDWIIEAEPNKTYNLYEEYANSSSFRDYVYTSQWIQGTYGIDADDGGNILVKLPTNLSAPCMIKIYAWRDSMIVVIAPDGKHIIDDNGTNTDSSEGFSGGCLHVYVYQPNNSTYGTGAWRSQHFY